MDNNNYTIDNLPKELKENQFYVFGSKNGKIAIGNVIGETAINKYKICKINGIISIEYLKLSNEYPKGALTNGMWAYLDYKSFYEDYQKYIESKQKKKKTTKTRYAVNKFNFFVSATRAAKEPYNCRMFDKKEDAIEYANKKIKKLKKEVDKHIAVLNELNDKLIKIYVPDFIMSFDDIRIKPSKLKIGDAITKISNKRYSSYFSLGHLNDDYIVTVEKFISPVMARLSDGTILTEQECRLSTPFFIKCDSIEIAKNRLKYSQLKTIKNRIKASLDNLDRITKYIEKYEPLKTSYPLEINVAAIQNIVDGVIEWLNDN